MIYPLIDTMRVSLYTQNLLGENMDDSSGVRTFIGLRNYYDLFFNDTWSWHFWNALKNNFYFISALNFGSTCFNASSSLGTKLCK